MRAPIIQWKSHLEMPAAGSLLIFDYGSGPVVGTFYDGHFLSAKKRSVDRILVNRWRYCNADEKGKKAA